jgi:glucuronosyltransferase
VKEMPKEKLNEIIEAFKTIKQKVLWKFEGELPVDLPSNILARPWIPQSDVLAHPKVVLFISHGGVLGVQEALYRVVPMIFIPFLSDQQQIAAKLQFAGCGLVLPFDDITKQSLSTMISQITADPSFKKQIFAISTVYKDRLMPPMEEAIFWIEFAMRHKGAKHLKSSSIDISICKYLMLDVLVFYIVIFVVWFLLWVMSIKLCIRRCRNKEVKGKFKYY